MTPELTPLGKAPIAILDGDRGVNYPKKSELKKDGDCLFLNTSNVTDSGFDFADTEFVSKEKDQQLRKGKLQRNDIVLTTRGTVGNSAFYGDSVPYADVRINSGMVVIRVDSSKIDPYYVYTFLRSDFFKKQIRSHGSGSAQPQLPIGSLKNIMIPLCELPWQQRIAEVVSTFDDKIDLNYRICREIEDLTKMLYGFWFAQFDFPISDNDAEALSSRNLEGRPYRASGGKMVYNDLLKREIPAGWEAGNLERLGNIVGGSTPSTANPQYFAADGTPWITPKDLSDNVRHRFIDHGAIDVNAEGIKAASLKLLPAGSVLMSSRAPIGYLAIARKPTTTNQGFKSFVPREETTTDYIYSTLKHFMKLIKANASGSTFREISGGTLRAVRVPFPDKNLIKKFSEISSSLSAVQSILERENQSILEFRNQILPMLLNGQVSVH